MHEAQLHERTSFITLTYDNDNLVTGGSTPSVWVPPRAPSPGRPRPSAGLDRGGGRPIDRACNTETTRASSVVVPPPSYGTRGRLHYPHVQKFLRALRKVLRARRGLQGKISFYVCGEYGEQLTRPHYHLALFGEDFREDRYQWRESQGLIYYRSPLLEKLWPHGNSEIGNLTFESAAYIARYIMKKITGKQADTHYERIDPETGERYWLPPEFNVMSKRPAIGKGWFEQYKTDVYPHDHVVMGGMKFKPPRYYDNLLKLVDAYALDEIQQARAAGFNHADNTPARLAVREDCAKAKLAFKKRKLENL